MDCVDSSEMMAFCEKNRLTLPEFFRIAHYWNFAKDVDITIDVLRFQKTGEVPQYAQIYLAKYL